MKTYTVHFRTDADSAIEEFKARSPQAALRKARAFYDDHAEELLFTEYDGGLPVNEIEVFDANGTGVAIWYDDEMRLRLAAGDLRDALEEQTEAAEAVIDRWEKGDLAGAVRGLDACIASSRAALAKAGPSGS